MKKKTLRQQLRYIRVIMLPRPKRTGSYMDDVMIPESNERLKAALASLFANPTLCFQGIEGGHDFIESGENEGTCIYCGGVVRN
jgi:hypothetical protein